MIELRFDITKKKKKRTKAARFTSSIFRIFFSHLPKLDLKLIVDLVHPAYMFFLREIRLKK